MITRSKVKGMVIGGAHGDALAFPVETWTPERIEATYPTGLDRYHTPFGHKFFTAEEMPPGSVTDDTQLTEMVMRAMIDGHPEATTKGSFEPYMDAIAAAHVVALKTNIGGWGSTTVEAIRRLANGVHWQESGKTTEPKRGRGNGVPMKCSPLAAWLLSPVGQRFAASGGFKVNKFNQWLVAFSAMTHHTRMSAEAGIIHTNVMSCLLGSDPAQFVLQDVVDIFDVGVWAWGKCDPEAEHHYHHAQLEGGEDELRVPMNKLGTYCRDGSLFGMDRDKLRAEFGNGSCDVYDSLPFAYAFFLKNPHTPHTVRMVGEAGGDTDTNAKIVGEMIGALHGLEIFEKPGMEWIIGGLRDKDRLLALADEFCDTFEIK